MIRVLVVDDSLFMRTMIRDMLEKDPEIDVVATAVDGVDALKKIGEYSPDVMTLDIEMPRMDGLEVLRRRSQVPNFPKVLMLSSLTSEGAEMTRTAMSLGADDFMLKPREPGAVREIGRELIEKIRNLVRISYVKRKESLPAAIADTLVVIGASAGGPPMLDVLLSSIESPLPAAVVITQHMPEGFTASFARRLDGLCKVSVKEASHGERVLPGHAYVAPGHSHLLLVRSGANYVCELSQGPPVNRHRPSVDVLFRSAANCAGPNAIGVILTGMGKDGAQGMLEMKRAGAYNFAQDEASCVVYGMPREAVAVGAVDEIVPLSEMAARVLAHLGKQSGRGIRV
ncbi:MAG: chemotaxis response regulator protein-glutamate methylesterase [Methanolinea sp.]